YVILISLSLSWLTAITTTPLLTYQWMKPQKGGAKDEQKDPYGGKFYQVYKKGLESAIRFRWVTLGVVAGLFVVAMIGFGYLDQMFFPSSTSPQFLVECQWRSGNHIRETEKGVARMEEYLLNREGVTQVASSIASGHPRFLLTYSAPSDVDTHYAVLLVTVDDYKIIDEVGRNALADLEEMFPDVTVNVKRLNLGPGEGGKIQLRINGPDRRVLRQLADKAMGVIYEDGNAQAIRTEWGEEVKVIRPVLREDVARRLGIDRPQVAEAIASNFQGMRSGLYREDINLIPIVTRAPAIERMSMEDLRAIQIYSSVAQQNVPMSQVVSDLETVTENVRVTRYHRRSMIKVHCDA
ncbi:MAG: efflux RND transporter permease subunit, partial [Candidatus Krumholzibacteria bacterium]|nr:efflux RND transporter permease subunit [Candidatus Krumholzibacteria bacterium]